MKELYFAHPVNTYNTAFETACEILIAHYLLGGKRDAIENPNQLHHQEGYRAWKKGDTSHSHRGMSYFFDMVLPNCNNCIALPYLDERFGLGVAGEMKFYVVRGIRVWIIEPAKKDVTDAVIAEFVEDPVHTEYFTIRPIHDWEIEYLIYNDTYLVVPHEETRLRTWVVYNKVIRPYTEAHLVELPIPDGFYPKE
ncbi:MAG: hypothetical protein G01um101470_883 [Parcubacteria group bacterium Gr01-1014_70]|nr:MAG: hypothetical protein G01um101470_883 [Parcubacteria group bacterium Gr01-1014_70]